MNDRVCVLLSYYKGEKYISEQVDSILNQDYMGSIEILIRNDGPLDEGIKELEETVVPPNRKISVYTEDNLGPQRSFLKLIQDAPLVDFYFFSDQDDVWKEDKIRTAVECMKKNNVPSLWCSNYDLVDEKLNILKEDAVVLVPRTFHFLYAQMFNTFPGCVMGFNRSLYGILKDLNLSDCMMHDSFAFATAIAVGNVDYDEKSYTLHRIHGENVVGTGFRKSTPIKWIRDKSRILREKENYDLTEFAGKLFRQGLVKNEWEEDVQLLERYRKSVSNTLKLLNHRDVRKKLDPESLSIHCKILFRLF